MFGFKVRSRRKTKNKNQLTDTQILLVHTNVTLTTMKDILTTTDVRLTDTKCHMKRLLIDTKIRLTKAVFRRQGLCSSQLKTSRYTGDISI